MDDLYEFKHLPYKLQPYEWQLGALERSDDTPNLALLAEMGTGKSKVIVEILRRKFFAEGRVMRTLILGPVAVIYNWQEEILTHSHVNNDYITVLHKSGKARVKQALDACINGSTMEATNNCIIVSNYEAMGNKDLFNLLKEWQPEIIVCDESHLCKNPKALRSKRTADLAKRAKNRYILTGTPILNSPEDIFQQYKILDGGDTFGTNYWIFMNKYFVDENAGWAGKQGHFRKMVPRTETFPELTEKIYGKAIRVLKKDCLDLPERIEQVLHVPMNAAQTTAYNQMKRDFVTFVKDMQDSGQPKAVVAQLAVTKALRLMQITCGFATDEDGKTLDMGNVPRLDTTKELLQELTPNHKVILWCSFKHNYEQLSSLCKKLGIKHVFIVGSQSAKEKQNAIEQFRSDDDTRVVIANRRAGGTGINLVEASYSIVYSRNFSLAEELQSKDRNYRGGSQIHKQIVKIDLCSKGTIDELCLEALSNKKNLADSIIDVAASL